MPRRKREKAKSAFDSEKRRSEAAAFFISVKGIDRGNKAVRVDYSAKEKKGSTKKLRVLMAVLAVVMVGVISAGGYLIYQEFFKLGPPSQPVSASAASSGEDSGSSVPPVDPNDRLLVVGNSKTSLPDTFALDLQEYEGIPVDSQLLIQLKSMVRAAAAENVTLQVEQGYVAEEALQKKFDDTVSRLVSEGRSKAKAEAEALKTTLPAGKNEWSTGLLIRFANPGGGDFSNSDAYKWLSDHSVDYGFVIRYPENKTEVTGIETAQPQVFRFVGVENAKKMRALAFCVEEYADYIQEQKAGY